MDLLPKYHSLNSNRPQMTLNQLNARKNHIPLLTLIFTFGLFNRKVHRCTRSICFFFMLFNYIQQFQIKTQQYNHVYFLNLCNWGAESLTLPGILRATISSLTPFNRSFSRTEHVLSRINICRAVFDAFPRRPVPGVIFTLYL